MEASPASRPPAAHVCVQCVMLMGKVYLYTANLRRIKSIWLMGRVLCSLHALPGFGQPFGQRGGPGRHGSASAGQSVFLTVFIPP